MSPLRTQNRTTALLASFGISRSPDGSSHLIGSAGDGRDHPRGVLEGVVAMRLEMARAVARSKGFALTPEMEEALQRGAAKFGEEFEREKRTHGIARHIIHCSGRCRSVMRSGSPRQC